MMGLAKGNLEIDAQIEAAIKRNEDMNRAIAEAEHIANQQGSRLEHHTWMQGELQRLEESNCQKMATLKNLEEKISTLEKEKQEKMMKNAMAKQQQNLARLSPQTQYGGRSFVANSLLFGETYILPNVPSKGRR